MYKKALKLWSGRKRENAITNHGLLQHISLTVVMRRYRLFYL